MAADAPLDALPKAPTKAPTKARPDELPRELQHLNPAQREAVVSDAAPLCILAGAGSGKTRVLTRRVAWRVHEGTADPRHVLVVTFTRKAAGELASRLSALGVRDQVASGTFHALAYAQLRRLWADAGRRQPTLLERKVRLLSPLLPRGRDATVQPVDVATEIEWAKAQMIGPDRYEHAASVAARKPPLPAGAIASIYERYEDEKRRRGLVDFDDLLLLCAEALERDREFAAGQRWRFRHLFVDEFQDVNPAQFRLLQGWRGDRDDLCVVGDPNQGIFSWNGADVGFLTEFPQHFPGATVLRLDDNYRSSPEILAVANAVLGHDARLHANRAAGMHPSVTCHPSDREEAQSVARAMRRRHSGGVPWSHQAVLTRTNAQLVLFEEALRAAQVPYRVKGRGSFLDQPEVRQALIELRRQPAGTPLLSGITDIDELLAGDGPEERRHELEALVRLAREHAASDPTATIASFGAWLVATVRGDQPERAGDAVTLATFHAAKGLEWPVVFLAGLERGLVPIGHADSAAARAEERRLLYVAVTRAERELHCSWAERRTFGSRTHNRTPSPWLDAVEATLRALAEGGDGTDWRRHVHEGRATLQRAPKREARGLEVGVHADPAVYQALKTWRSATARDCGVPAFVIFHDTTLAAVAEAKPRDRHALLALPGMGPVKADRYGDELLAVVAEHVSA
ncbi:MAG: ATP-dependent DNA helicase UvrD2 [Actinobacteria bacterium]|nr:MAG: ATP-dependent DNA helicase UvrD2 [Actinomycetota bacterium]